MTFYEVIRNSLPSGEGRILIVGREKTNPLSKGKYGKMIYHIEEDVANLGHTINLVKTQTTFDLLRVGNNVDSHAIFNWYCGFVREGGLLVVDNPNFVPGKVLGSMTSIYTDENSVIFQRGTIEQDISFAIVIATYYRKLGTTKRSLERAARSIVGQSYQNYKVFLVGDKYENDDEFNTFKDLFPEGKVETLNLPVAWERENCKVPYNLWCVAGATAMNNGIDLAVKEGFKYYAHLDDDDYWHPFHLRNVAMGYKQYPETTFVCTMGILNDATILPSIKGFDYNNFLCAGGQVFHSSYGFRLDIHPLRYHTFELGKAEPNVPADGDMLNRIGQRCSEGNLKTLAIPILTCLYDYKLSPHVKNATIDELADEIKRSRSDKIVKSLSQTIKTFHHHYHLLYDLRTMLGPEPKRYCEIGVYYGGSSTLMLKHPYETSITGIDVFQFGDQLETLTKTVQEQNVQNREVSFHKSSSQSLELVNKLKSLGHKVDLLFIDGDHSHNGVILDFELHSPFVNSGGFIVFDDYNDKDFSPEVKGAVDLIVQRIQNGEYPGFEVIGTLPNFLNVQPATITEYNEFIVRRILD